jgi:hypothetical protein
MGQKYTDEDLENIIALADQDDSNPSRSESLVRRCTSALVYSYRSVHLHQRDIEFLRSKYDPEMDTSALETLKKIVGNDMEVNRNAKQQKTASS